jgi:Ca2+/Na+ antiporter
MLGSMSTPPPPEIDRRRVRLGLLFLTAVVLVALAIAVLVDNGLARVVMLAIVVFTVARMVLIMRSVRRDFPRP